MPVVLEDVHRPVARLSVFGLSEAMGQWGTKARVAHACIEAVVEISGQPAGNKQDMDLT